MRDSLKIASKTTTQTATTVQSAFQLLKNGNLFVFTKPIATSKNTSTKRNYYFAHWKYLITSNKQMQTFAILTAHGPFCHWTWTQTQTQMTWRVTKHTSIQKHINMQKKQHRDVFKASVNNTRIQRMRMSEIKKTLNSALRVKRYNSIKAVKNDLQHGLPSKTLEHLSSFVGLTRPIFFCIRYSMWTRDDTEAKGEVEGDRKRKEITEEHHGWFA